MTIPFSPERYGDAGRRLKSLVDAWAPSLHIESLAHANFYLDHGEVEIAYEGLVLSCIEYRTRCGWERAAELYELGLDLGLDQESVHVDDFWERAQKYFAEEEGFFAAIGTAALGPAIDPAALVGAAVARVREVLYVEGAAIRHSAWVGFADGTFVSFDCKGDGSVAVRREPMPRWVFRPPYVVREIAGVRGRITSVQSTMDWEGEITIHCEQGVLVVRNWGDQLVLLVDGVLVAE